MSDLAIYKAMASAEASVNMEEMCAPEGCEDLFRKIMNKKITFEEYLKLIIADGASV